MRIRLNDPGLVPDLRRHFERSGFVTNQIADETIQARHPDPPDKAQARREIEAHLAVWRAMHPEAEAELTE
jgi:hypothetical protein